MRKKLFIKGVTVFLFLLLSSSVFGFADFSTFVKRHVEPGTSKVERTSGEFFKTLEPKMSLRGTVKSYVVHQIAYKKTEKKIFLAHEARKFPEFQGKVSSLNFPVSGEISSLFGYRSHPFKSGRREFHAGIDIRGKTGTPFCPAAPGRVVFTGWRSGYGLTIEIDHGNGLHTIYAHCSKIITKLGVIVSPDSPIGNIGRTGVTTGSHLHFEVKQGGVLQDPLKYLKRSNLS